MSRTMSPGLRQSTVAICGNPNCGKTTVFNAITGLRQKVGNYPGVTVERISGQFRLESHPDTEFTLVDIPGTYSLAAFSPDEYIAARALFGGIKGERRPDVIICLIDATNLRRGLYLLFQTLQIGRPVVVGLNMIDLASRGGTQINYRKLSNALGGIPVVPMVGSRGKGIDRLKHEVGKMVADPRPPCMNVNDKEIDDIIGELASLGTNNSHCPAEYMRVLFDIDGPAEKDFILREGDRVIPILKQKRRELVEKYGSLTAAETSSYTRQAERLCRTTLRRHHPPTDSLSNKLDSVLLHPVLGPIVLIALMTLMFQSIFSWAEPLMGLIDTAFAGLAGIVEARMVEGPLRSLITDGVIGGVGSILVFLPQIMILFLYIALLEDSGYMPRAAFIVDRAFRWCGLSGKSFIPMLSSFACAVPGLMATRTIEDRKLRIITIMVAPLMTCSARLPVYTIMIAAFIPQKTYVGIFNSQGLVLTTLYMLGIITAVLMSFVFKKTLFKTERGTFMMEMPTYKLPTLNSIIIRVFNRAKSFVLRAGTVILAITIIVWALSYYPRPADVGTTFDTRRAELTEQAQLRQDALVLQISTMAPADSELLSEVRTVLGDAASTERLQLESDRLVQKYPPLAAVIRLETERRQVALNHQFELHLLDVEQTGEYLRRSYLARMGHMVEPAFRPLGWDWRITMAALASFPAREIIVASLGTIFNLGADVDEESTSLIDRLRQATWDEGPRKGQVLFSPAVALSIMVFFALCCQCSATVVTIKQEAGGWKYAWFVFGYMTVLAYVGSLVTYQLFAKVGL